MTAEIIPFPVKHEDTAPSELPVGGFAEGSEGYFAFEVAIEALRLKERTTGLPGYELTDKGKLALERYPRWPAGIDDLEIG